MIRCKLSSDVQCLLCCPVCKCEMMSEETQFRCKNSDCTRLFPVINGVPVLLNESNSIFSIGDFICGKSTTFDLMKPKWKKNLHKLLPKISLNVKAKNNVLLVKRLLLNKSSHPRVLVVGGSIEGEGMSMLGADIETVSTDVSFGPLTELICDAHDLPFINQSFEGVVIQAVLEHVVDPYRCVEEVHRVLKSDGIVYAETPFMQQVHMGRYDFTRFTHLGHRRLFRKFFEIESGASCGTGMALISAIRGFLQSLTSRRLVQRCLRVMVSVTLFWLKYLDYLTIDKPATNDAASGLYFIGGKAQNTLSDRELLNEYKGAQ